MQKRNPASVRNLREHSVQVLRPERDVPVKEAVPRLRKNQLRDDRREASRTDARPPVGKSQIFLSVLLMYMTAQDPVVLGCHRDRDLEVGEIAQLVGHRSSHSTVSMCAHRSFAVGRWS